MRFIRFVLLAGAASGFASPVAAAETLKFGPAPTWVIPQAIPNTKPTDAPVALLLNDQQVAFESGKTIVFAETAMRIQNPQGLSAGSISFGWDPARDTVTVNKFQIRRGDKVIDVLGAGQTFTILRRESNLEAAMLDGTLTANIQPEGLQEGDIIDLATTVEHFDPVLKGHGEATFAAWNGLPVESARARVIWPAQVKMRRQQSSGLPTAQVTERGGKVTFELSADKIEPLVIPKNVPVRFSLGRLAEVTDFNSWADVADLFAPLYRDASVIPGSGPLRDELDRIRSSTTDPARRAEQALALVQDRIRYVALLMGQGGYVPAAAETTWSRRFGDCKGKTALLLGLLRELGIQAEPVLVNSSLGDAIGGRLPMAALFNHVLVRAHIGAKDYWLDGTRTGDTSLARIEVPDFGWVLPLVANAKLVHLLPPPLSVPNVETKAEIDASAGIYAAAPTSIETVLRGDAAVNWQAGLLTLTEAQRQEFFRNYFRTEFDFVTFKSATYVYDRDKRELRISMKGEGKLDWNNSWFHVPNSSLGFSPNFDRTAGPLHDVPLAVAHPRFERALTQIRMPKSFLAGRPLGSASVNETLAGVEYRRNSTVTGDVLTIDTTERSLAEEIPYQDALAARTRLKAISDDDVYLPRPNNYTPTTQDLAAFIADKPETKDEFFRRGFAFMNARKFDEAISDFSEALKLDPSNVWSFANRGICYVWKQDFQAAEKDLASAEKIDPNNVVVFRARALMAEQKGDHKTAVAAYSKSLEREPGNGFALGHRALSNHQLGDEDAALADSAAALKKDPAFMDLRVMRANIFQGRSDRESVAREAELVTSENPDSDYAFVVAGKIYARIDRREDAMKAFDKALVIKPSAYIYVNRAQSRPFTDYAGRLADLDAALKLEPDNVEAMAEKAEQLAVTGDLKGALALYDRVVKIAPDNQYLSLHRAIILYKTGSVAEAERIISERRSQLKTAGELNGLCWTKATAGIMLESAAQDCLEALKLKPDLGPVIDSLAFVRLRMGKFDEAISLYSQAIEKKTGSASYMGRAIAYARKGDSVRAQADRAEALNLDGDAETRFAEYGMKF